MKLLHATLCALAIWLWASCANYNQIVKTQDYTYKYEAAKQYYAEGQYNRAAQLLQDVLSILKGTDQGEESLYLTGLCNMKAHSYDAAATVLRKYYQTYPKGKYAELARFNCAQSLTELVSQPNLFVATFLGTPPINLFDGRVEKETLYIGGEALLPVPGIADQAVTVGIRPEGFVPEEQGPFSCKLLRTEIMGRDVSFVCTNDACRKETFRAIIQSDGTEQSHPETVRFRLKPGKVLLFDENGSRLRGTNHGKE